MRSLFRTLSSTAVLIAAGLPATVLAQDKAAQIEELLAAYHEHGLFDGSALVAEEGRVIFKKGFGEANMEWEIPNGPDTRFRLGSITKQFTATVIMQLVGEGKIDLEAPMSAYLPEYRRDVADQVTIHHLLTHTSGIPSYTGLPGFFANDSRDAYEPDEFVRKFCSGDLEFEPGSQFRYNNSGYFLLGVIIEKVTGKPYEEALQERIFAPLGMHDTGYDHHETILSRRATGYQRILDGFVTAPYLDMSAPYAAGALYSTVEDLYAWDRALYDAEILPAPALRKMFTPNLERYGYGWTARDIPVGNDRTTTMIGHGGGINGFNTFIGRLVDDEHLVVLLSNAGSAPLQQMTRNIVGILYGSGYEMPEAPAERRMLEVLLADGEEAALEAFEAWKQKNGGEPSRLEQRINSAGYQLLGAGRIEDATRVFLFNVTIFPEAFNTHDSLGEAHMVAGRREDAIRSYARSLELNPDNRNAVDMLAKLVEEEGPTPP